MRLLIMPYLQLFAHVVSQLAIVIVLHAQSVVHYLNHSIIKLFAKNASYIYWRYYD